MKEGLIIYSAIKRLLLKYNVVFKSDKEYENFIKDLSVILEI